jgi:hypothetical protein
MKAKWLGVTLVTGVVAAGCGQGRAIFNVDVYSFLKGTPYGGDTVPYFVPPGPPVSAQTIPGKINLPGAGKSIVDSVSALGTVDLRNATGSGTIGLQVYLAADSAGTYNPSNLAITVPPKGVSPATTTPDTIRANLTAAFDSLFTKSQLWIGFKATGANSGATLLQGKAVLTSLLLTVVIKEQLF